MTHYLRVNATSHDEISVYQDFFAQLGCTNAQFEEYVVQEKKEGAENRQEMYDKGYLTVALNMDRFPKIDIDAVYTLARAEEGRFKEEDKADSYVNLTVREAQFGVDLLNRKPDIKALFFRSSVQNSVVTESKRKIIAREIVEYDTDWALRWGGYLAAMG